MINKMRFSFLSDGEINDVPAASAPSSSFLYFYTFFFT